MPLITFIYHFIDVDFKCAKCEISFERCEELRDHMKEKHADEPTYGSNTNIVECFMCKIRLPTAAKLKQHMKKHVAARDKKCEICEELFTSKEITGHICDAEKSIDCEYCGVSFKSVFNLLNHLNEHDNRTLYRCRKCPRFFGMDHIRTLHEKHHKTMNTKTKSFICDICSKGFAENHLLKAHLASHSDERK